MNVPKQTVPVDAIAELYRQPTFKVTMEEDTSTWTRQEIGIRRGCPLSPYIFLMFMTCLFRDVHTNDSLTLAEQRIEGTESDKTLYADDTFSVAQDEEAMNILKAIKDKGRAYGLNLNGTKCEYRSFGDAGQV